MAVSTGTTFLQTVNDPHNQADRLRALLTSSTGTFVLCLGSTETSEVEGISAAGATAAGRRLTPSIDADVLTSGKPRDGENIPVSPVGIVSPVVITRACLRLLNAQPLIIDCGTFRSPLESYLTAGELVAKSVSTARALPLFNIRALFNAGRQFAIDQLRDNPSLPYLLIAECVPGGTTTALAVLKATRMQVDQFVSSSLPAASGRRIDLVNEGLSKVNLEDLANPFDVLAAFGDPMQPFVAGAALAASQSVPVILGGGSQMLAVYHICRLIAQSEQLPFNGENLFVVTTKWISNDAHSDTRRLSEVLRAPFFASSPDFTLSKFAGLQAYEDGHVKEGVGAGAMMAAAAMYKNLSPSELMSAIDQCYEEIILQRP